MNAATSESNKITRRKLLKWAVGAGAFAALTGGVVRTTRYPQLPGWKGKILSPREAWIFIAACEIVLPESADTAIHRKTVENIDSYLSTLTEATVGQIHLMLNVVEHLTLANGNLKRFTRLDAVDKAAYLEFFRSKNGMLRMVFRGLRDLCLLGYYQLQDSWKHIGYDGPLVGNDRLPLEKYERMRAEPKKNPTTATHSSI